MSLVVGVGLQGQGRDLDRLLWLNPDGVLIMQEGILDARWLRSRGWQGQVLLRWYEPNTMGLSPSQLALRVAGWLEREDDVGISGVILWNEQNLDAEHAGDVPYPGYWKSPDGYRRQADWQVQAVRVFRQYAPRPYQVHYGALAPGHNPPGWAPESEYDLIRDALAVCDVVDVHVYGPIDDEWTGTGRLTRIVSKLASLGVGPDRVCITETNQVNYVDLVRWLRRDFPQLQGVFWFLWRGNPEHAAFDLAGAPYLEELRQEIAGGRSSGTPPSQTLYDLYVWTAGALGQQITLDGFRSFLASAGYDPDRFCDYGWPGPECQGQTSSGGDTAMALKDQFPDLWSAWTGAGGDEEHFFAHLVGIGALPPTPENLLRVIQALKGDLAGLEEAVKKLPLT